MNIKTLIILLGSARGGEETWIQATRIKRKFFFSSHSIHADKTSRQYLQINK